MTMGSTYQVDIDGKVTTPNMMITPEGGLAIRVYNDYGTTIVKGTVVKASNTVNDAIVPIAINDPDPIGIVYASILTGTWGWIVVAGRCEVLVTNASLREWWLGTSATVVGQADGMAAPPGVPTHFNEIGHTQRAGGPGLVFAVVHFN